MNLFLSLRSSFRQALGYLLKSVVHSTTAMVFFLAIALVGRSALTEGDVFDSRSALNARLVFPEYELVKIFKQSLEPEWKSKSHVLAKTMIEYCRTYEMDPAFILAVIQVESRFQSNSKSHKNAQGLMQVLPSTAQYLVEKNKLNAKDFLNLHDPVVSLKLGILYFSEIRRLFKNDSYYYHVAAYNLGPSKLKKLRQNKNFKPDQTLVYYKKIMAHYRRLRKLEVYSFEI